MQSWLLDDWHRAYDERPLGITALAIFYFINAAIAFIGIGALVALSDEPEFFDPYPVPYQQASAQPLVDGPTVNTTIVLTAGIIIGVIGGINALIGYGLMKARGWARNLAIAFAIINIIFYSIAIPVTFGASLAMVFFNGFILWYLYRPHVTAYFA